jgi:hypothetical protein
VYRWIKSGISRSDVIQELVNAAVTLGETKLEGYEP